MEGTKKVCPDDIEELWVGKKELRAAHTGGSWTPCGGHGKGGRWAFRRAGDVDLSFFEHILPEA